MDVVPIRISQHDEESALATYACIPPAASPQRKRTWDHLNARTLLEETLPFTCTVSASLSSYPVRLTCVTNRAERMQAGHLMHPSHAALLDVLPTSPSRDTEEGVAPIVTLPLDPTSARWIQAMLALPASYTYDATLTWHETQLHLHMHIVAIPPSCWAAQTPVVADRLRAIVEYVNTRDGIPIPTLSLDDSAEAGAALVYESLARRESDPATQMPMAEQPRHLQATLLPFQRRSVSFLLEREVPVSQRHILRRACGPWWLQVGQAPLYFHVLSGQLTVDQTLASWDVAGAILAEEMGLGKTVEVLSLLLERQDPTRGTRPAYYDAANDVDVQPVGATLIVSPETLRRQWLDEIAQHAPTLRVYSYTGHRQAQKDYEAAQCTTWGAWTQSIDVMVVSFETLARELAASHAAPVRQLRQPSKYERPRSPLVQLEFLRVVMDEVQLVGGNAAKTMGLIHRTCSLAVSGTPVRRWADVRTSLWFLGLVSPKATPKVWARILSPAMAPYVYDVLAQVGIRHTKAQVAHEMVLPLQTRYLVPVDFTHVETAFYKDVWHASLAALHLDADGAPLTEDWELDASVLRAQLIRLRQACTHPHVAMRGGHVLGSGDAPLGVVNLHRIEHVLAQMMEATRHELLTQKHNLMAKRIYRATILLFAPWDELQTQMNAGLRQAHAAPEALAYGHILQSRTRLDVVRDQLETLLPEAQAQVAQLEQAMQAAQEQGPLYRFTSDELTALAQWEQHGSVGELPDGLSHGTWRLRQQYIAALKSRQRHWLQVVHRIQQFSGHCYFQLGEAVRATEAPVKKEEEGKPPAPSQGSVPPTIWTPKEDEAYQAAELTRQRLLAEAREAVEQALHAWHVYQPELVPWTRPTLHATPAIAGRSVLEAIEARLDMLRDHAALVWDWRTQIATRLSRPVNREVNKAREDDDMYAENLDAQIEAETLMEMYRPLLAQRDELVTGRIALGATARPQLFVELDRALRSARSRRFAFHGQEEADDPPEGEEDEDVRQAKRLQLQHFRTLEQARQKVILPPGDPPLTMLVAALRDVRDASTRQEDIQLLTVIHAQLQTLVREQTPWLEKLRREQMLLQTLFNARAIYFKQMQELSDQVQDPDMPQGPWMGVCAALAQEKSIRQSIGSLEGRLRYLTHVERMQQDETQDSEARQCFICTNTMDTGVLTNACGHVCCETCFHAWMRRGHRTCPLCKTRIAPRDIHRIVYRAADGPQLPGSKLDTGSSMFHVLPTETRQALLAQPLPAEGSHGTKLDLLLRHLVYLQRTTGEKSLVFSSFARGLDLVAESLEQHGLRYARIDGTGGKRAGAAVDAFQHDPDVRVLLLHSEAQSAGLNLLAATHLFLLEPLLNYAMELQAMGRVHRIGQTRPTFVYGYMVRDTVEERIVGMAAARSQSLYLDTGADADSAVVQAAHLAQAHDISREARRGDLIGAPDDLLACLFPQHIGT